MNNSIPMLRRNLQTEVSKLIDSLTPVTSLTEMERRNILARYNAVLEGNFIAWMTAALLASKSEDTRAIIQENLTEEIRDNHPGMLRRFTLAANAAPDILDYLTVSERLQEVRNFVACGNSLKILTMMAFFEKFISEFMSYLARLASDQGSTDFEYTDVHGPLDVLHTEGLIKAIEHEMACSETDYVDSMLEGVPLLAALMRTVTLTVHAYDAIAA
jgi:hypothetical protein